MKEDPEQAQYFKSFHLIWQWILEVYYSTPRSKYHWPEFKKKALIKGEGEDLRRRMIVYNYKNMLDSEQ